MRRARGEQRGTERSKGKQRLAEGEERTRRGEERRGPGRRGVSDSTK